jgi:RNA recognition motif-containing protein
MKRRLFVDNFSPDTTPEALEKLFQTSGKVESVTFPPLPISQLPSHAFVVMTDGPSAAKAIQTLNNTKWNGLRLTVTHAGPSVQVAGGFSGQSTWRERQNKG